MSENKTENAAYPTPLLTWPEVVRKRPGMYFGGTDNTAVHELVRNVINQAVDETLGSVHRRIEVVLHEANVISIHDNGEGLPVELDPDTGRPFLDFILTGVGGKEVESRHRLPSVSMYDVGLACVNAVSAEFLVQVSRNGFLWQQQFKEGKQQSELEQVRPLLSGESSGTTIKFRPDFSIFVTYDFDYKLLAHRCRELAYLIPGITMSLRDERSSGDVRSDTFFYPDGLKQYVLSLNNDYVVLHDPIVIKETIELKRNYKPLGYTADVEIALQYAEFHQPVLIGFVNTFDIEQGGTHVRGLIEALTRAISDYAAEIGVGGYYTFIEDDIVCGLAAILNIWHPIPEFAGAARYELTNPELENATYHVTLKALEAFSAAHPDQMQLIVEKCLKNKALRFHRRHSIYGHRGEIDSKGV